ncbi:2-hydroxyacyl-CoA dehydratase family protein [Butyrivibrio proteoclasticus]|uniref:2-hydroxyacyl-CoA dehydratase family protein n=1 Tax=Butyrivibrio proteoclasticus TaxID=43305 RepID=UPI00047AE40E|nr:2-hydroxyacyl-CoA dehydratase family protein [Butyrivibrio proteoclasticus]
MKLFEFKKKYHELFVVEKRPEDKEKPRDVKKAFNDFWNGKPHEERRLGDLYVGDTGLYKHREWRGFMDTMYYFNMVWLYNYAHMVTDIVKYGDGPQSLVDFAKGVWRYRWMGQTYLSVMHWFDRGMEGMRGEALRASAWHYRGMVSETIRQFQRMFIADKKLHGGKENKYWKQHIAHNETVGGSFFYPFRQDLIDVPLEMITYFVSVHVNNHTVLKYIDAAQSIGLPSDPCPMCQAEYGLFVEDDYPDYAPTMITSNEACDGSVATSVLQDWFLNRPLYALPQPMRYDDPLVQKHAQKEIEGCWKFIEEQYGVKFDWDTYVKYAESFNKLTEFEWEKWDVAANTENYPINGVAQALYRIYYSQAGDRPIWHECDEHVRKIMNKTVKKNIITFPKTRHRAIAWSCAPLYYSNWCTWAYNCWGINCVINMDSLMFDQYLRTDTYEHALEDLNWMNEKAPMRAMAVGGHEHILSLFDYMERFNCDMVIMYDQLQCKGMQGIHGVFEDEFRKRDIHAIWVPHALPDKRTVSRKEIRKIISDYMTTVMHEEPLDPTLVEFDDDNSW